MPEYTVNYAEVDDFRPPRGEVVVNVVRTQNGACRVTTEEVASKRQRAASGDVETRA